MPIPRVPIDVVNIILSYLPTTSPDSVKSARAVALTCKAWLEPALRHIYKTSEVKLALRNQDHAEPRFNLEDQLRLMEQRKDYIREVKWICAANPQRYYPNYDFDDLMYERLAELFENRKIVHDISVRVVNRAEMREVVDALVNTRSKIGGLLHYMKNLALPGELRLRLHLQFTLFPYSQFTQMLPAHLLISLELDTVMFQTAHALCSFVAAFSQLESLELWHVNVMDRNPTILDDTHLQTYGKAPKIRILKAGGRDSPDGSWGCHVICCWLRSGAYEGALALEELHAVKGHHSGELIQLCCENLTSLQLNLYGNDLVDMSACTNIRTLALEWHGKGDGIGMVLSTIRSLRSESLEVLRLRVYVTEMSQWHMLREVLDPYGRRLYELHVYAQVQPTVSETEVQQGLDLLSVFPGFRRQIFHTKY